MNSLRWILIGIGFVFLFVPFLIGLEWHDPNPAWEFADPASEQPQFREITTVQPGIRRVVSQVFLGTAVALFGLCILGEITKWGSVWARRTCLIVVAATPISCCVGARFTTLAPWQYGTERTGPDGQTYYVMESSFLQGQTLVLARCKENGLIFRTSHVLVETNGDNPRFWQSMVRPSIDDAANEIRSVTFSPDGLLFGYRYDNHCFFAYDIAREIRYGRNRIREISPFASLGPQSPIHEPDVGRIEDIVRELDSEHSGVPTKAQLEEGLMHPNPAIPPLARKLLALRKE